MALIHANGMVIRNPNLEEDSLTQMKKDKSFNAEMNVKLLN